MSLPFPTNRFPSFTLGPTPATSTEAERTVEITQFPTAPASQPFPDNILQQSGLTPGQVIGITVGATAGLVFFIVALVWVWNWRRERQIARRAAEDAAADTVPESEDPEKDDGIVAPGETLEMPAPRGLHEMPLTANGPPIELPAPIERSELPG